MKKIKRKIMRKAAKFAFNTLKDSAVKSVTVSGSGNEQASQSREKTVQKTVGSIVIREMRRSDRAEVIEMMREACSSKAALTADSDKIFGRNITECLSDRKYIDGFVFAYKDAENSLWGYAIVAHCFNIQSGKPCMWIEDLYLREEAKGLGLTSAFLNYMEEVYPGEALQFKEDNHRIPRGDN